MTRILGRKAVVAIPALAALVITTASLGTLVLGSPPRSVDADPLPVCYESGTVAVDTSWDTTCVHLTSGLTIAEGATLTIEPGTVVKMQGGSINVLGSLWAHGTPSQRITITSYRDDAVGGDTNGDGPSSGAGGDWSYILLDNGVSPGPLMDVDYVDIRFGGNGGYPGYPANGMIQNTPYGFPTWPPPDANAIVTINHSAISYALGTAVAMWEGSLTITNSTVSNSGTWGGTINSWDGISTRNTTLMATYNTISFNYSAGLSIYTDTNAPTTVANNSFNYNGGAMTVQLGGALSGSFTLESNTATGNHTNAIAMGLTVPEGETFTLGATNPGMPYILGATVNGSLVIDQGAVIKAPGISVSGAGASLVVNGTAARPVYFTSFKDDTVGGDTNGDGNASQPGIDWTSIHLSNGASLTLEYSRVRFGGANPGGCFCRPAAIQGGVFESSPAGDVTIDNSVIEKSNWNGVLLAGSSLTVRNSVIRDNYTGSLFDSGSGIYFNGPVLSVTDSSFTRQGFGLWADGVTSSLLRGNSFKGNLYYGLISSSVLDAAGNWWGNSSGPTPEGGNCPPATGSGDKVSCIVNFFPWLTAPSQAAQPILSIDKSGPAVISAVPGSEVTYNITVSNSGSAPTNAVAVTDSLPESLNVSSAAWSLSSPPGSGTCTLVGRDVSCNLGEIEPGSTATAVVNTTLRYVPTSASVANMACWSATDPPPANGQNCDTAVTGVGDALSTSDLRIDLSGPGTASRTLGTLLVYTASVANHGPNSVPGVMISDSLDPFMSVVATNWHNNTDSSQGSCTVSGRDVACPVGTLPSGGTANATLTVQLSAPPPDVFDNWIRVTPSDSFPWNNADWLRTTSRSPRIVVFVQGINSEGTCTGPDGASSFIGRVSWIADYLTSTSWIQREGLGLSPWTTTSQGSFRYFSYSPREDRYGCAGGSPKYGPNDTCDGVEAISGRFDDFMQDLFTSNPGTTFDVVAHSLGGLVASYWASQHLQDARDRLNSIILLDSMPQGIPWQNARLGQGGIIWAYSQFRGSDGCSITTQSVGDMIYDSLPPKHSSFVRGARTIGGSIRTYTLDAGKTEFLKLGSFIEAVPGIPEGRCQFDLPGTIQLCDRTSIDGQQKHRRFSEAAHSDILDGNPPAIRTEMQSFVGCAVSGDPAAFCTDLYEEHTFASAEVADFPMTVGPDKAVLSAGVNWSAGDLRVALVSPTGELVDQTTTDPLVWHESASGFSLIGIHHPTPGTWTIRVTALAAPPEGAASVITADTIVPPAPDEDRDSVPDGVDNCHDVPNASQDDADSDGVGDACDSDDDSDGIVDSFDNCPLVANADQADTDGDGVGDACDGDNDNDAMQDIYEAARSCLLTGDDSGADPDSDGLNNLAEYYLGTAPCSSDSDADGVRDNQELYCGTDPLSAASSRAERVDGTFAGVDDDGDTEVDEPLPATAGAFDCDGDGFAGVIEQFVFSAAGTRDDQDPCGNSWPPDLTGDHRANLSDILRYIPVFNTTAPGPPYNPRFDLNANNNIGLKDVLMYIPFFNLTCTP